MADKACLSRMGRELGSGDLQFSKGKEPVAETPGSDIFCPVSGPYFGQISLVL